jgi:hypothetical protein
MITFANPLLKLKWWRGFSVDCDENRGFHEEMVSASEI